MKQDPSTSRREFLIGLGGSALAVAATGALAAQRGPEPAWRQQLAEALGGGEVGAIGRAYLRAVPGEAHADRLHARLYESLGPASSARDLRERLEGLCRRDFAAGRCITLDGWRLARSEARACALLSLG
ncbi:MAG: hypothetical protein HKP30_04435 [Myxococcales bacterium]|nr:hypothetical protein [Myxococcales bacterium]